MSNQRMVIVGGGLAGLSTACYARKNGWKTTIVEHNLTLGGVCAAWQRGPYTVDGCIQWLTGGGFTKIYEELGVLPATNLRPLDHFATYRHLGDGTQVKIRRDLEALRVDLRALAPEDGGEIDRLIAGCEKLALMDVGIDRPPELATVRDRLRDLWELRHELGTLVHFRSSVGDWRRTHLQNPRLRSLFGRLVPDDAPAFFLLFMLGYLGRGFLSRPQGGTAAFRDAIVGHYESLGGETLLNSTVEEIVVEGDRARGVRLTDGSLVPADLVVSTASAPETVFRLLASHYGADALSERLERWKLFQPIVLASYGVGLPLAELPATLIVDGIAPLSIGGHANESLTLRVFNDEPSVAPPGHTVVQVIAQTNYDWWATRGARYGAEKDALAETLGERIEAIVPGFRGAVRMSDMVTPVTFWRSTRSWRGAYEGWMPNPEAFFGHVPKTLPGLDHFYMAGQWVEPGGGIPTALLSGRQLVQVLCQRAGRAFKPV